MVVLRRSERVRKIRSHTDVLSEKFSGNDGVSKFGEDLEHDLESDAGIVDIKSRETRRKRQKLEAEQEGQVAKLRRSEKYVRGRRGHLKLMTEMPIDTLHEIFRQLDPLDLLYLSWANKSLHAIVMEKSARYIWREVYERLYESNNPPRCPEDLNFVQYTRFLYHKKCMICHTRNAPYTCWMMRLRVCHQCLKYSGQFFIPEDYDSSDESLYVVHTKRTIFVCAEGNGSWLSNKGRSKLRKGKKQFEVWEARCSDDSLDRTRVEWRAAISEKLKEIGWDESNIREINEGRLPDSLPGFGTGKKFTKKVWENAQPKLENALAQKKKTPALSTKRTANFQTLENFRNKVQGMGSNSNSRLVT